ncbi:MAG: TrmH family RNA methyltransferase [Leeuwenhoekiella sp.]
MSIRQLTHRESISNEAGTSLVLVCDNIASPANAGSIIRLADAFGIQEIYFCGSKIDLGSNRLKRTSRSTQEYVKIIMRDDIHELLNAFKGKGMKLIGLEITNTSIALQKLTPIEGKAALILGNERRGLKPEILSLLDHSIHIDMYGKNSSMNVGHAAAIALYELRKNHPIRNIPNDK